MPPNPSENLNPGLCVSLLLQNALAEHVIPNLPDVTKIPDASWHGWDPVFQELQVDRANSQQVQETISRCQTTLANLLQAAILNGQNQAAAEQHAAQVGWVLSEGETGGVTRDARV